MRKTAIKMTLALRQAVSAMQAKAGPNLVGLVMRFNEDDATIRDLWSEGSNAPKNRDNPHQADRPQMFRYLDDNNPVAGTRAVNRVQDTAGFHAEEMFIACWAALLRGADLREDQVRSVDIVLSKSPCHGASASSMLQLGGMPDFLPIGCASKLASFVAAKNLRIAWRIAFLALAGSDAADYTPVGGDGVDRLMNPRDRQLATAAATQVQHRDVVVPQAALRVATHRTNASDARDEAAEATGKAKGEALKRAGREDASANRLAQQTQQTSVALFNQARTLSIGNAQAGIAKLEGLANVDIRRWAT